MINLESKIKKNLEKNISKGLIKPPANKEGYATRFFLIVYLEKVVMKD